MYAPQCDPIAYDAHDVHSDPCSKQSNLKKRFAGVAKFSSVDKLNSKYRYPCVSAPRGSMRRVT